MRDVRWRSWGWEGMSGEVWRRREEEAGQDPPRKDWHLITE